MATDHPSDSSLPPPQPPDANGTRPKLDLAGMIAQVLAIQRKLAEERREKRERAARAEQEARERDRDRERGKGK